MRVSLMRTGHRILDRELNNLYTRRNFAYAL